MYSAGEEFEKVINGDEEYFTCLANITVDEKEYLICENESGIKKVFFYDTNEEDLILLEEDEEDEVLEIWEEEYYDRDKDYMYWNEEFGEYDEVKDEEQDFDDIEEMEDEEDSDDILVGYDDDEEDIDEFLDDITCKWEVNQVTLLAIWRIIIIGYGLVIIAYCRCRRHWPKAFAETY